MERKRVVQECLKESESESERERERVRERGEISGQNQQLARVFIILSLDDELDSYSWNDT